jgi:hypothetical protein
MSYETLQTIHQPFCALTPVLWRCGELAGIHRIEIATPWCVIRIGGAA